MPAEGTLKLFPWLQLKAHLSCWAKNDILRQIGISARISYMLHTDTCSKKHKPGRLMSHVFSSTVSYWLAQSNVVALPLLGQAKSPKTLPQRHFPSDGIVSKLETSYHLHKSTTHRTYIYTVAGPWPWRDRDIYVPELSALVRPRSRSRSRYIYTMMYLLQVIPLAEVHSC